MKMLIINPRETAPIIKIKGVQYTVKRNPVTYKPSLLQRLFKPDYSQFRTVKHLINEYEKIKNKKSHLPRRQRDYIIKRFEKEFVIKQTQI